MRPRHWLIAIAASAHATPRCQYKSEAHGATYELAPLAKQQEISFGSSVGDLLPGPFAQLAGMSSRPQQSIVLSLCADPHDPVPTCNGESAPGILVERPAEQPTHPFNDPMIAALFGAPPRVASPPSSTPKRTRCAVLGRRNPKGPQVALLDDADPGKGLLIKFDKGDECRPGQRFSLLIMLECHLGAQGLGSSIPARVQARAQCEWVISVTTAAACPVNVGELCAPNCPRTVSACTRQLEPRRSRIRRRWFHRSLCV